MAQVNGAHLGLAQCPAFGPSETVGLHAAPSSAPQCVPGTDRLRGRPSRRKGETTTPGAAARPGQVSPVFDAELVIYRLEEAGSTLLALPGSGYSTRLRQSRLDVLEAAVEGYGAESGRIRAPVPSAARITRMDEALGWVVLIPRERYVLRRIVGARALVSPVTERHLFSWRRLGTMLGADHKAVQRWHAQGIDMLVAALNRPGLCRLLAEREKGRAIHG